MSVLEGFWKYIIANFAMDFGTGVAFIQEGCIFIGFFQGFNISEGYFQKINGNLVLLVPFGKNPDSNDTIYF